MDCACLALSSTFMVLLSTFYCPITRIQTPIGGAAMQGAAFPHWVQLKCVSLNN